LNAATNKVERNAKVLALYMALGPSNTTWRVAFSDELRRWQVAGRQASWGSFKKRCAW
jgi:hypothetical protein